MNVSPRLTPPGTLPDILNTYVLVSAGTELTFFLVAGTVLLYIIASAKAGLLGYI